MLLVRSNHNYTEIKKLNVTFLECVTDILIFRLRSEIQLLDMRKILQISLQNGTDLEILFRGIKKKLEINMIIILSIYIYRISLLLGCF